jgi:hypothetical protein
MGDIVTMVAWPNSTVQQVRIGPFWPMASLVYRYVLPLIFTILLGCAMATHLTSFVVEFLGPRGLCHEFSMKVLIWCPPNVLHWGRMVGRIEPREEAIPVRWLLSWAAILISKMGPTLPLGRVRGEELAFSWLVRNQLHVIYMERCTSIYLSWRCLEEGETELGCLICDLWI